MARTEQAPGERVPWPALALGAAGLVPFGVGVLLGLVADGPLAADRILALRGYGACILSFMGGVHWGLAIHPAEAEPAPVRLAIGTMPALIGWAGLLLPSTAGFLMLAIGFGALLAYDLRATRQGRAPAWYPTLRVPLTLIVLVCLLLAPLA